MPARDRRSPRQSWETSNAPWKRAAEAACHRVVTLDALRAAGFTDREIDYRTAAGYLRRRHRGVYVLGPGELPPDGEMLAGVEAVGADAVASRMAAAWLWALVDEPPGTVDVTVPRRVRGRDGIRVHCVRHLAREDMSRRRGVPVTSVPRTLLDLAADGLPDERLTRLVNEALVQRRTSVPSLHDRVTRAAGRRGATRLLEVLETASPTRSALEDRLLALMREHGLPRPVTNARIAGLEVDLFFPDAGLVVEADGRRYHDNPIARARDARRDARLAEVGLDVARVTWDDVVRRPEETVARIAHRIPSRPPWTSSTAAAR